MSESTKLPAKFWILIFAIFAVLATIQIVGLIVQNRNLKQAIAGLHSAPPSGRQKASPPDFLKIGDRLEPFKAVDAEGKEETISYTDRDYLLLITATKCPWCEKTMPVWNEIAEKAKGRPIRIVAVSLDGKGELSEYIKTNQIKFEVVNFADPNTQMIYKAFATPQTILVKQGGTIEKTWRGMLTEANLDEVTKLFPNHERG
jgi:peroxiredoxin